MNRIRWWDEFADLFSQLREFIALHGFRVSMHPGQFTVLNSPDPAIVAASRAEVEWHVRFLDCLGTSDGHKIIVHVGGTYGAKEQAARRFVDTVNGLPESWRRRLAVENDERAFTVEDVLDITGRCGIPVVFDWLHHRANRGPNEDTAELLERCFATWKPADGVPKLHLSSQLAGGRPGRHANWIDPRDFMELLRVAPPRPFDCMLEAKKKDLALLRLREFLRARGIAENGVG